MTSSLEEMAAATARAVIIFRCEQAGTLVRFSRLMPSIIVSTMRRCVTDIRDYWDQP